MPHESEEQRRESLGETVELLKASGLLNPDVTVEAVLEVSRQLHERMTATGLEGRSVLILPHCWIYAVEER